MQVPKATLDFFGSFHVLVRVSVMGGLSSFEGRPTSHLAATCTHVFADSVWWDRPAVTRVSGSGTPTSARGCWTCASRAWSRASRACDAHLRTA